MSVQRIFAKTSREALRRLKNELGEEAVILSNRPVEGGVEILAMPASDVAAMTRLAEQDSQESMAPVPPVFRRPPATAARVEVREAAPVRAPIAAAVEPPVAAPIVAVAPPMISQPTENASVHVLDEIRLMRESLEAQIADMAWSDLPRREPLKSGLLKEMLNAGFSAALARKLMEKLPAGMHDREQGLAWVRNFLVKNLITLDGEERLLEQGGIFALMGPTGVGKTTTTAKLAARFVVRHGAEKLALLTTDSYRIGGQEHLRIFGKILGVTVHAVRDGADLRLAVAELRNKHTILIDTVGMSQRDSGVAEQLAMFSQLGRPVKKLLLLNATSHGDTLNEVVQAYQGQGLDGCILTKLDEAASLGSVLDCAIRHRLNVHYLATGQRVPEDLHLASRNYLIHRAFKMRPESSPYGLGDEDLALAMSLGAHHSAQGREMAVALG
jgi:flagellar biosynthesis protein FlhF